MKGKPEKLDMDAIARMLGVSKTTVHYAIRNTGRLSEHTRKRVLKTVESMGYRPDGLARSFRRRRTDTLGIVVVTLTNSFHAHMLEGVEVIAQEFKHAILVACSHGHSDKERELVNVFLEKGVNEPNMPMTRQRIVLEPTLVVRESSGAQQDSS
jgi:LacI family transcriptional regulator